MCRWKEEGAIPKTMPLKKVSNESVSEEYKREEILPVKTAQQPMMLGSGEINHIGPGEKSQYRPDENRQSRVASPPAVLFTRPVVGQPVSW